MTMRPERGDRALAVIVGRAGSRGLPGKNAMYLAGRPMVVHTIEHARAARTVGRVVVTTDGPAIAAAARAAGVQVVDRPAELATDTASVQDAVRHAVTALDASESIIVILYANVPIRPSGLIDGAVERLRETGADSVQSYSPVGKHHPHWMASLGDDGVVTPFVADASDRRQDLPPLLMPDGGVIAVTRESLFTVRTGHPHDFFGEDRRGIVSPEGSVVDVDTDLDYALAQTLLAAGGGRDR
ncbi:MAG: acylneuraminate cytidylyltransferase family protein [Planctomycetota bacterium]|jgi:CMP-N-acetylneuraminic acid synthetase